MILKSGIMTYMKGLYIGIISCVTFAVLLAGGFLYLGGIAHGASISSVQSGNWSDSAVWSSGQVPATGDTVSIQSGDVVVYNIVSNDVLGDVSINGTLKFSRTENTRLKTSGNIFVRNGGYLNMGIPSDFIQKNVRAEVIFVFPRKYIFESGEMNFHDFGLWVMGKESKWDVHGAPLLHAWSKLASNAPAGSSTVTVESDTTDWYVGGSVVITQTSNPFRPGTMSRSECTSRFGDEKFGHDFDKQCNYFWENEVRQITQLESLGGGKTQITRFTPLSSVALAFIVAILFANDTEIETSGGISTAFSHVQ